MIDLLFLSDNEVDGVSQLLVPETCFLIGGGRKWTCLNIRKVKSCVSVTLNGSEAEVATCERCVPPPLSHIASIDTFSVMAITVSALSYSAISQPPPPPQPPNPSTSSFNLHPPALPAYRFSIFPLLPPSSPLSPSSLHLLKHFQQFSLSLWVFFF